MVCWPRFLREYSDVSGSRSWWLVLIVNLTNLESLGRETVLWVCRRGLAWYLSWCGKIRPLWAAPVPEQRIPRYRRLKKLSWALVCIHSFSSYCSDYGWNVTGSFKFLPCWLPHNDRQQPRIVSSINPFSPKLLLSEDFITGTGIELRQK